MQSLHLRLEATQALRQQLRNDAQETDVSLIACMILLAQLDVRVQVYSLLKSAYSNRYNSSALETAWNMEPT